MSLASTLHLDVQFARDLPELAVPWNAVAPTSPDLVLLNEPLLAELGLDPASVDVGLLTGTSLPGDASPVAQVYAGHQFGGWSPRLGDGRALLLGELVDAGGRLRDLALKGSGPTPLSRGGDGFAALGPMLREYVISEAMHALGIPTTRSLAVVATGRVVHREDLLPGAVLTRVAASHLRVGSFQYARSLDDPDLLRRLVDHAIRRHHPSAAEAPVPALALFDAVVDAQASLIAQWMLVGFIHGVMNTDNMTISGETIDYGPCAFLEAFDPATVYSSIDTGGRYAYGNQPLVAEWNLARFAEALLPLIDPDEARAVEQAVEVLGTFRDRYSAAWTRGMTAKLGLGHVAADDLDLLLGDLVTLMRENRVDHTLFFRGLTAEAAGVTDGARGLVLDLASYDAWAARWRALSPDVAAMRAANPVYVPRNHRVEEALASATAGDLAPLHRLLEAVTDPFTERPGLEAYAEPAPASFAEGFRTFCGT